MQIFFFHFCFYFSKVDHFLILVQQWMHTNTLLALRQEWVIWVILSWYCFKSWKLIASNISLAPLMQDVWETNDMIWSQRAITIWSTLWWYLRILSFRIKSLVFVENGSWKSKWKIEDCFLWVSWEIKAFEVHAALAMWVELKTWKGMYCLSSDVSVQCLC